MLKTKTVLFSLTAYEGDRSSGLANVYIHIGETLIKDLETPYYHHNDALEYAEEKLAEAIRKLLKLNE